MAVLFTLLLFFLCVVHYTRCWKKLFFLFLCILLQLLANFISAKYPLEKENSEKSHFKISQRFPFMKDIHSFGLANKLQVHFIWIGTVFPWGNDDWKIPANFVWTLNLYWSICNRIPSKQILDPTPTEIYWKSQMLLNCWESPGPAFSALEIHGNRRLTSFRHNQLFFPPFHFSDELKSGLLS